MSRDPYLRKQPRQSRSKALVDAVLEATDVLLSSSRDGQEPLTLQSVAKRAGVGIGSLYDYFANADGVWGAFVRRITQANFDALKAQIDATEGRPLLEMLPGFVDTIYRTYLDTSGRTEAVINAISRLNLTRFVVAERDRFAALLAERVLREWPQLDRQQVFEECEVLCDATMGVVLSEMWRERDPASRERVRQALIVLVVERVRAFTSAQTS